MKPDKLIFVYNADEGFFNALTDWTHKIVSPSTYQCSLCLYTYGLTGMRAPWKAFLENLGVPTEFHHRPDFREKYPGLQIQFPAVLAESQGEIRTLLSADELNQARSLDHLMDTLKAKLCPA